MEVEPYPKSTGTKPAASLSQPDRRLRQAFEKFAKAFTAALWPANYKEAMSMDVARQWECNENSNHFTKIKLEQSPLDPRMQKSSNLVEYSALKIITSLKHVFVPKASPNDGRRTMTKLTHQSPNTPPFAYYSQSLLVGAMSKYIKWTSTLLFCITTSTNSLR